MERIFWANLDDRERRRALARPARGADPRVIKTVERVFAGVAERGDAALRDFSLEFDGKAPDVVVIDDETVNAARGALDARDIAALEQAAETIIAYHRGTRPADCAVETAPGVTCRCVYRPLERVGLYVPGGSAPLISSLLMLAIPARVAGVCDIAAVTPPSGENGVAPAMIIAASLCGLPELRLLGGAQAVAALALGTETIPPVAKIFGPGNAFVAAAKTYAASLPGGPAIDLPAGPSELFVIADDSADPALVAADLLSQAEHDRDAQVLFACTDERLANAVAADIEDQLADLPRAPIARAALESARLIIVDDLSDAASAANLYAPEHLALHVRDPGALAGEIATAGAIFCGARAAEAFGDYINGPSHVLPTDGAARGWSGVNVSSFMRAFAIQEMTAEAARRLAPAAARLARLEGLEAHARAALARLESGDAS
ncbi:MAG: histidinol dehydrogenase [Alphaproteobacteria bacterium]|nr:histidinol dehydrogenase [Alphaproteobacteria bacterium]